MMTNSQTKRFSEYITRYKEFIKDECLTDDELYKLSKYNTVNFEK